MQGFCRQQCYGHDCAYLQRHAWTTLTLASGSATATFSSTTGAGSFTIAAAYSGDTNNSPSSGQTVLTVNQIATTASVSFSPNPITYGGANSVCGFCPEWGTGTVALTLNGTAWTMLTLVSGSATATFSSTTGVGSYTIAAAYSGDTGHSPSSGSTVLTVTQVPPRYL